MLGIHKQSKNVLNKEEKMKRKPLSVLLAASMVVSMTACGQKAEETTTAVTTEATSATETLTTEVPTTEEVSQEKTLYTEGTYTGTTRGMNGDLTVEVSFSSDSITDIAVKDQVETYGIGYGMNTTPIEVMPKKMVEAQSVNIDSITGATITSMAIKRAVSDCVGQAGGDIAAMAEIHEAQEYEENMEADVVVVGGGAAGLSAAIAAAEAGADVVIVEKQGITGGSTTRSGGKVLAAGTSWQTKQNFEDTPEQMYDYLMGFSKGLINENLLKNFCDASAENLAWLEEVGMKVKDVEPIHSSLTPWRVHNSEGGGGQTSGHGGQITVPLTNKAEELGIRFVYNTSGKELITNDDGSVKGVKAVTADGKSITINSNAVILATGGYASSEEMMARYKDFLPSNKNTAVPVGNIGEGLTMAEAIGAKNFESEGLQLVYVSYTCGVGINEESGLIVSANGERVVNEWSYQSHVAEALAQAKSPLGYYIATDNDPNPTVQYGITLDSTIKAATVEELAEQLSMDSTVLKATVDRYNELCAKGEDEDFGKPAEYMIPLEGETYYAIAMNPGSSVTFGGLEINENSQVLNTENKPIKGLYAAGEVAFTGLFGTEYPCCGMAIGSAVYFGRIAGTNAAAEQ